MCGIIGSITKEKVTLTDEQKAIRGKILGSMALAMQDRGTDSTGIATIKDRTVKMFKKTLPAIEFIKEPSFNKLVNGDFKTAIGHTRFATVGAVTDDNAHPYKRGSIVGCHNGSVFNWQDFDTKANVDSEVIFYLLNKNKNNYKKTFKKLRGSFAIAWQDLKEPNVLFLATHSNPLFMVRVKELQTIFFLSEEYYLQSIINTAFNLKGKDIIELKDDFVYRISKKLEITKKAVEFEASYQFAKTDYSEPRETITENGKTYAITKADDLSEEDFEYEAEQDEAYENENIYWALQYNECIGCDKSIDERVGFWFNFKDYETRCAACMTFKENDYMIWEWIDEQTYKDMLEEYKVLHEEYEAKMYLKKAL